MLIIYLFTLSLHKFKSNWYYSVADGLIIQKFRSMFRFKSEINNLVSTFLDSLQLEGTFISSKASIFSV